MDARATHMPTILVFLVPKHPGDDEQRASVTPTYVLYIAKASFGRAK